MPRPAAGRGGAAGEETGFLITGLRAADETGESGIESAETTGPSFSVGLDTGGGLTAVGGGGAVAAGCVLASATPAVLSELAAKRHTSSALSKPTAAKIHGARRRQIDGVAWGKIDVAVVAWVRPCVPSSKGRAAAWGEDPVTPGN